MQVPESVVEFSAEQIAIRRDLHAHPELGYEEHRTAGLITEKLTQWGIPFASGIAGTGIIGIIKAGTSSRAIGLRADMDALPMPETNEFEHHSVYPGKMHACGHDGHTAMLLGAARYFASNRNFDGTVYVIFQPAEENGTGAKRMIEEGLFQRFPMQAIFGMHNWPGMPAGEFGVIAGPMMASSSAFKAEIKGKGSHGAQPHQSIDPLMIGVQLVQSWQSIVSRNINPIDTGVLSVTQFHAGSAHNVISDTATLGGTVRTFRPEVLDLIENRMSSIATHIAQAHGAEITFTFTRGCPALSNDPEVTQFAIGVMQELVGHARVNCNVTPTMSAEDFSFMTSALPGCYVFIGNGEGDHRDIGHGMAPCDLHSPSYDFNDELMLLGTNYWIKLAEAWFAKNKY